MRGVVLGVSWKTAVVVATYSEGFVGHGISHNLGNDVPSRGGLGFLLKQVESCVVYSTLAQVSSDPESSSLTPGTNTASSALQL